MRARSDHGATLVEAALVLPVFLLLIFGMIDFGYGIFQDSQATSAARDGARYGIIHPTDTNGIRSEVRARAVGQDPLVEITCLSGSTGETVIPCSSAQPGTDRIRVVASWDYKAPTGVGSMFGASRRLAGSSTMVIVGEPVAVSDPEPDPAPPEIPAEPGEGEPPTGSPRIVTTCTGTGDNKECDFHVADRPDGAVSTWSSTYVSAPITAPGYQVFNIPKNNAAFTVFVRLDPMGIELSVDVECSNGDKGTCYATN